MSTYEQMATNILADIGRSDATTLARVKAHINRSLFHYMHLPLYFNQNIWGFKMKPSVESLSFASASVSDALSIKVLTVKQSTTRNEPLKKIPIETIRQLNDGGPNIISIPVFYSIFQKRIYFSNIPDNSYSADAYGIISYPTLSASADTNAWLVEAEDLIESRTKWAVYSKQLHNPDMAAIEKDSEMQAKQDLLIKTNRLLSTGKIVPRD